MQTKSTYTPNTTLHLLDPSYNDSLRYGDFGHIRWVYKPHFLASTQWEQQSILDEINTHYSTHPLIVNAYLHFGHESELGMLTRIDNDTAGMIWFAKDPHTKELWKQAQQKYLINKIYEADVVGRMSEHIVVHTPIMHHRFDTSKMIVVRNNDTHKGRWRIHEVSTIVHPQTITWNNTHIQAIIHQWCRHQIRVHCSSLGNSIIGDTIYTKNNTDHYLHLRSVGLEWDLLWDYIMIDYHLYN